MKELQETITQQSLLLKQRNEQLESSKNKITHLESENHDLSQENSNVDKLFIENYEETMKFLDSLVELVGGFRKHFEMMLPDRFKQQRNKA